MNGAGMYDDPQANKQVQVHTVLRNAANIEKYWSPQYHWTRLQVNAGPRRKRYIDVRLFPEEVEKLLTSVRC